MWPFSPRPWKVISQKKQDRRSEALTAAHDAGESDNVYLTASATDIVEQIQSGRWTASQVLEAYISRSALSQDLTNCLTEVFYDRARDEAKRLDSYFAAHGKIIGPLHGVPLSFKDLYNIEGYDTTLGYSKYADQPASADAEVVAAVRQAGGIPFVKTNVPQTMFIFETVNPMWGRTSNPWSAEHTPGGSSGGEAALLAMDGSALGWGSDIGGSLRIPASYCGVYSLKPGLGRIASGGTRSNVPGEHDVPGVFGPMGRTVQDIELACRVVFGQDSDNYDPAPIPYQDVTLPEKLKFGYYVSDGMIKTSPVCKRAVLQTVEALCEAGHECVEIVLPNIVETITEYIALTTADGAKVLLEPNGNDPEVLELASITTSRLPGFVRWLSSFVLGSWFGDTLFPNVIKNARPKPAHEYWKHADNLKKLIREFNKEVWREQALDGIIAPVQAVPAVPHRASTFVLGIGCMTAQFNAIDSPVGTLPVTRVDPTLDGLTEEYTVATKDHESAFLNYCLYRADRRVYNVEKMKGLPVGIQIVGKKWEEEKVVAMMKVVDRALGPRGFGPGAWKAPTSESSSKGSDANGTPHI